MKNNLSKGFMQLLPLFLLIFVYKVIYSMVNTLTHPTLNALGLTKFGSITANFILTISILVISFFLGMFIRTNFGNFILKIFEKPFFKVMGYKAIRDIVSEIKKLNNNQINSKVGVVDLSNSETFMVCFIMEEFEHKYSIYRLSALQPAMGLIDIVDKEKVKILDGVTAKDAISMLFGCGKGSKGILKEIEKN